MLLMLCIENYKGKKKKFFQFDINRIVCCSCIPIMTIILSFPVVIDFISVFHSHSIRKGLVTVMMCGKWRWWEVELVTL